MHLERHGLRLFDYQGTNSITLSAQGGNALIMMVMMPADADGTLTTYQDVSFPFNSDTQCSRKFKKLKHTSLVSPSLSSWEQTVRSRPGLRDVPLTASLAPSRRGWRWRGVSSSHPRARGSVYGQAAPLRPEPSHLLPVDEATVLQCQWPPPSLHQETAVTVQGQVLPEALVGRGFLRRHEK